MAYAAGFPIPLHYPTVTVTATTYTVTSDLGWINANPGGAATWTLPVLGTLARGALLWIRNISANAITLNAGAGNTVGGGASTAIPASTTAMFVIIDNTDWKIVEKFSTGGVSVSSSSTSAVDNAIVRFDGTSGQIIQNSLAVIDDTGLFGSAANPFRMNTASVTQLTNNTTAVTLNANSGKITMFGNLTTAAGATSAAFTVNNSIVAATSKVFVTISNYTGTVSTNGNPIPWVAAIGAGSFTLQVFNAHAANALAGTVTFDILVV